MTCIMAYVDGVTNKVSLIADKRLLQGTYKYSDKARKLKKIIVDSNIIYLGSTGTCEYSYYIEKAVTRALLNLKTFESKEVIDNVISSINSDDGLLRLKEDKGLGEAIFCINSNLYYVCSPIFVTKVEKAKLLSIGSGGSFAEGAFLALKRHGIDTEISMKTAIEVTARCMVDVSKEYNYIEINPSS